MLPVWLEVILAWLALGCLLNALGFSKFYINLMKKASLEDNYDTGYYEAMINIETFCNVTETFPSRQWILSAKNKKLKTKDELFEHGIETIDHRSIKSNYYFK